MQQQMMEMAQQAVEQEGVVETAQQVGEQLA